MKFLLDENLPAKLRFDFGPAHTVRTAREQGWNGLKDGALLRAMAQQHFDALITQSLRYQQDVTQYPLVIFLLLAHNSKQQTWQPLVERLQTLQWPAGQGQVIEVR